MRSKASVKRKENDALKTAELYLKDTMETVLILTRSPTQKEGKGKVNNEAVMVFVESVYVAKGVVSKKKDFVEKETFSQAETLHRKEVQFLSIVAFGSGKALKVRPAMICGGGNNGKQCEIRMYFLALDCIGERTILERTLH